MSTLNGIKGCGIGLRSEHILDVIPSGFTPDWLEITPENWMSMPYHYKETFEEVVSKFPIMTHGLSLSIGSPEELNMEFLKELRHFFDKYKIEHYSEHLSFSTFEGGQTYELLPLPLTRKMIEHISDKVKKVEDFLGRQLILENATYYTVPYAEMEELDFMNEVMHKSGAKMLLDVNNVFVNARNHNFDARAYIKGLDHDKVAYMHVAGHKYYEEDDIIIDTHGADVCNSVWELLDYTLDMVDAPVMIERDNDIPSLDDMREEYKILEKIVHAHKAKEKVYA
ncbi:DUF692 domain-containing protein [Sulfurimonas sp. MAG313]|nr:DUF692 domain-containing protein [Sulfurimonas sp. MAG313]MDF1881308.1 DUF692 domain-containing protein [Sulfurimonas sp. MAG313]